MHPQARPLILFMDGHSSHYCPDTLALARENGIIIFMLPPDTTHLAQQEYVLTTEEVH